MDGVVVSHQDSLETPFGPENCGQQEWVFAAEIPVHTIVGAHNGGHMTHFNGGFERREIDFSERALVKLDLHVSPVLFFVVTNVVFGASPDNLSLDAFYLPLIEVATQERVVTGHVLE